MDYGQLLLLLSDNMHPESWVKSLGWDSRYTFTLRDNILVTIEEMPENEDNEVDNEFTQKFINKTASYHYYALKYGGAVIKNVCLYLVDGARAYIPAPRGIADTHIEDDDLIVGVIIDRIMFDSRYVYEDTIKYIERAGLAFQKSLIK